MTAAALIRCIGEPRSITVAAPFKFGGASFVLLTRTKAELAV